MRRIADPLYMPGSGLTAEEIYAQALPLTGTPGQAYAERRCVPAEIAAAAGVRFDPDFAGRPAVVVPMRDHGGILTAVHGRYLHATRYQNKMLTIGTGGGAVAILNGWQAKPLILVEGLFDALSLAVCGWASIATIGRPIARLAELASGRIIWAAFDTGRSGETTAAAYRNRLPEAVMHRLPPPPRCKDWNTALVKRGPDVVSKWLRTHLTTGE
ncbi:MAG: toprim domain-containing protein [Geobacteraceae bacterium]|nr:toprim domain-containing protein [Geobacteraceae bacterium]